MSEPIDPLFQDLTPRRPRDHRIDKPLDAHRLLTGLAGHHQTRQPGLHGSRLLLAAPQPARAARPKLPDGELVPLIRLRYLGSADHWGFGLYLASSDRYEDQILPAASFTGTPEQALDCACELYLDTPNT